MLVVDPRARVLVVFFIMLVVLGCRHEAAPQGDERPNELRPELPGLEQQYIEAYRSLYRAGSALKLEIAKLTPPADHRYSAEDLKAFKAMLKAFYEERPEHKDKIYQRAEARHIASITGLPEEELSRYQKAKGTYGLYKLTLSVENLPYRDWVVLYFKLIDIPSTEQDFSRRLPDEPPSEAFESEWRAFYEAGRQFVTIRDDLLARVRELIQDETDDVRKCQLTTKGFIYRIIAGDAGEIDVFDKSTGAYPLEGASKATYKEAAMISDRLGIEFSDLAYIQKKKGTMGLQSLLELFHWVEGIDQIIMEIE